MKRLLLLLFVATFANLQAASKAPRVRLTAPGGGWTANKVITVTGTVAGPGLPDEVKLYLNGVGRFIPLKSGAFSQKIVLAAGANYIKVEAANRHGTGAASAKLVTNNSKMDVKVILSWDTDNTDVDLHVTDPNDEQVFYSNRESKIGGTLDIDITDGFGPETFTLPTALPGDYLVEVKYYGGRKPTMAKVLVVIYEGTEKEKRYTFPALLVESGNKQTIGRFKVD